MTTSYTQIQKKIAALQQKADVLRAKEVRGVIDRIKIAIEHYSLTADQLGFDSPTGGAKRGTAPAARGAAPAPRYSDGQGNQWSGRGPRPRWLKEALAAGRQLEDLTNGADRADRTVQAGAGQAKASAAGKTSKPMAKRKAKAQYRDEAGNTWGGMGPRPRWLREAIASGTSLESLRVK